MNLFTAVISFLVGEILLFFVFSITVKSAEFQSFSEKKRKENKEKLYKLSKNFTLLMASVLAVAVLTA